MPSEMLPQILASSNCPYKDEIKSHFKDITFIIKEGQNESIKVIINTQTSISLFIRDIGSDTKDFTPIDNSKYVILSFNPKNSLEFPITDYKMIIKFINAIIDESKMKKDQKEIIPYNLMTWKEDPLQEDEIEFFKNEENIALLLKDPINNEKIPLHIRRFITENYEIIP